MKRLDMHMLQVNFMFVLIGKHFYLNGYFEYVAFMCVCECF